MSSVPHPDPFLEIRVDRIDLVPPLAAACAGFELGEWRCDALARHVIQWLPEFALRFSEWNSMNHADGVAKIARAALTVYKSANFASRGEFGEILLHILLRQHIGTIPAISKIYFKDSRNDTVKGFDAVHVLDLGDNRLELWLGEVKFYTDINDAISKVIQELIDHTQRDYLRSEFAAIVNKIDDVWPQAKRLRDLIHENRSLDTIFSNLCIPVLLTYDSETVRDHNEVTEQYKAAFETEVLRHWASFQKALRISGLRVHLFLLPLREKRLLVAKMDEYLRKAQDLGR